MHLNDFNTFIKNTFGNLLEQFRENDEYGFNNPPSKETFRVGYTTNLTPEVIKKSSESESMQNR